MSEIPSNSFLDEDPFFSEILSSQSDIEEQVEMLKDVLDSNRCIEDKLHEMHNFLASSSIQNIPVDILDEKIFNFALSAAQKLYYDLMRNIDDALRSGQRNAVEDIRNQLKFIMNLLKCWDTCIDHIKSLNKISVIDVRSFPSIIFDVMIDAIRHCKNSSINYGDYFQSVSETIGGLFRNCVGTLNAFYTLLDNVILFDKSHEEEMNILLKIIDDIGKLATLASGMETKTLVDTWKQFGKFSVTYCLSMKNISPSTVSYHFKGLSDSILTTLATIDQKKPRPVNDRSVSCSRVLLKILEKLLDAYCGWVRNDVMLEIIIMLTHLFRYTEQCLKITAHHPEFIKFILANFTLMIEPFLDIAFKNETFKIAFFELGQNDVDDIVGYHLLTLAIIKKILVLPNEAQREWYRKEYSVIEVCFQNIDKLKEEMYLETLKIQMSRDTTQGSHLVNIYEATCLGIFSLVCQITKSDFDELILILLKYLLNGKFFSALLSSDVWCFVCRLSSSGTCYRLFKYVMQVQELAEERKTDFNVVILSNLLSRQYTFLSDKDKADFFESITETNPFRWKTIVKVLDMERKQQVLEKLNVTDLYTRIPADMKDLEENPNLVHLSKLIKDLELIEITELPQNDEFSETFLKIWDKIVQILGDCEGTLSCLIENLAISVLRAIHPQGNSKYMTSVLQSMTSLYPYASSRLHLDFCNFFNRHVPHLTNNDSNIIAELFCRLLSNQDPCVQQQAFESLNNLLRNCPDAALILSVATTIKNAQSEVSRTLPAYISAEVAHELYSFTSFEQFFSTLCSVNEKDKHVCHKRCQGDREEKVLKLDEDAQSSVGLEEAERKAEKVCSDMEFIMKFRLKMNKETSERLQNVCRKFLDPGDR